MRILVPFLTAPLITTVTVALLAMAAAGCKAGTGNVASDGDATRGADAGSADVAATSAPDPTAGAADALDDANGDVGADGPPTKVRPEVAAAMNDFASAEGIARDAVRAVSVTAVTWPDSSLGCASPGEMYTQALVPGYEVRLSSGDRTAVYHTNQGLSGAIVVRRCGDSQLVAPADNPVVLDAVRRDLMQRVPAGSDLVLERSGPAAAMSLVCPGTPDAPSAAGSLTTQLAVSEVVFRVGADAHVYRVWNGRFVYCGIASPDEGVGAGTPTVATR